MPIKLIVLAKQVPDTKNITAKAMKDDGTVNRAALPAIFNPEDLNALEMALDLKDRYGGLVMVITMGPPRAADILREALYRGADRCILVTDRAFAGADTLATSYTLALAIQKVSDYDMVLCGRQAIDGDTAQIGPQVAEKIAVNQVTYVHQIDEIQGKRITLTRNLGRIKEKIETGLPLLVTVPASANQPRSYGAKLMMRFKRARIRLEVEKEYDAKDLGQIVTEESTRLNKYGLLVETWSAADLKADIPLIGLRGSPTKVKKVQNVIFSASAARQIAPTELGIKELMSELIEERTFG
ncbi:MAG: electron transfer flavoprotein subunit beta/FixA family protein [Candidatus Marinimicrobia bacterium]|nr:electron transfer flavoprotein subunit beta/FixA family protein [Candidatus Neomarinimicrobiota bacterium]